MVAKHIKLSLDLLFPLLGGGITFGMLQFFGGNHVANNELQALITIISLLVAVTISIFLRQLIHAELENGIAQLKDGTLRLPDELSIRDIFNDQIELWIAYSQPIHTTICIAGPTDWRYIDVTIERNISRNRQGKIIAINIDKIYPILEQRLQHLIFATSREDHRFDDFFAEKQLMNDSDISTFKEKLLATIEIDVIPGIEYGIDHSSISVNKDSVRQVQHHFIDNHDKSYNLVNLDLDEFIEQSKPESASTRNNP